MLHLVGLLLLVVAHSVSAEPVEQRCLELGSGCACSEPLDFPGAVQEGSQGFDPPDSEGPMARECGNNGISMVTLRPQETAPACSVGLSGPGWVHAARLHDNGNVLDRDRDFTNQTYCLRHYFRFSRGLPFPLESGDDVKGPRNVRPNGTAHPGVELNWGRAPDSRLLVQPWFHNSAFGNPKRLSLSRSGDDVTFEDCRMGWCRLEVCYDHDFFHGGELVWRGRLVSLATGKEEIHGPEGSPSVSPTAHSGLDNHIAKWWTDVEDEGHVQFFSHAMVAVVPVDAAFWIGPAAEIDETAAVSGCTNGNAHLHSVEASPDVDLEEGGIVVEDDHLSSIGGMPGGNGPVSFPGVPPGAEITAHQRLEGGDRLLSFDTALTLPGLPIVWPGDVVRYDGSTYSLQFDGEAAGIPPTTGVDAVTVRDGDLLLSFDTSVDLAGTLVEDEDLVRWSGGTSFGLEFDADAHGVDPALDLDAVHYVVLSGLLLLSFDGAGSVGATSFEDEDIVAYDATSGTTSLVLQAGVGAPGWVAADLESLSVQTDQDDDGLPDGVESGTGVFVGPSDTGTDPFVADSDGDGVSDGEEVALGTDPNDPSDLPLPNQASVSATAWWARGILALLLLASPFVATRRRVKTR